MRRCGVARDSVGRLEAVFGRPLRLRIVMDLGSTYPSASSFRDPAGYVFRESGIVKRVVTRFGQADFDLLTASGLYDRLAGEGLLVSHVEEPGAEVGRDAYKILTPEQIRHISYPYEWSFGQLQDAALLTLQIQNAALEHGMSLKDASAFNVQFQGVRPVFIDTLSFEKNRGGPWVAYGQFCRHFLAPLALMAKVWPSISLFLRAELDGFPLELASAMLPKRTWLRPGLLTHLHLHARSRRRYGKSASRAWESTRTPDRKAVIADSLRATIRGLKTADDGTEWVNYYREARHYDAEAERVKTEAVQKALERVRPSLVYDLGGNDGTYARLVTRAGANCVCYDLDPLCVHRNYERSKREGDLLMLPLLMDLTNPSPSLGFNLEERDDFFTRSQPDLCIALALIHHLRISGNAPLYQIAKLFSKLSGWVLIEFAPKSDVMVQVLLRARADVFFDYDFDTFCKTFGKWFTLVDTVTVPGGERKMCLFRRHA